MKENLAILGGRPVRSKPFVYEPAIGDEEKKAVLELMDSKKFSGFYKTRNCELFYFSDFRSVETGRTVARHISIAF